jgi:hypothetical protein
MILRDKKRGIYLLGEPSKQSEKDYLDRTYMRTHPDKLEWWIPGMEGTTPLPKPQPMKGAGDLVKKVTDFFRIPQCPPCKQRQEKLNKLIPFIKGENDGSSSQE